MVSQPALHAEQSVLCRRRPMLWVAFSGGLQGSSKVAKAMGPLSHASGAHFLLRSEEALGRETVGTEAEKDILDLGTG